MVHVCGILLIVGRLMHSGFHHRVYYWRRSGIAPRCALLLMVLANLWYMPRSWFSPSVSAQYAVFVFGFNVMSHRDTLFPRRLPASATGL